jgi:hypothetical protein
MEKHGLTEKDVELFTIDIPEKKRKERWVWMLHEVSATFSGVASISAYKLLVFAGDELGVNVARELFCYLKNEIIRKTEKNNIAGRKQKNDFRIGIVLGLGERMMTLGGWRDMLRKRDEVIKNHFSKFKSKSMGKRYIEKSFLDYGKNEAQDISLNRQAGHNGANNFLTGGE